MSEGRIKSFKHKGKDAAVSQKGGMYASPCLRS